MVTKVPTTHRVSNASSTNTSVPIQTGLRPAIQAKPSIENQELPQGKNYQVDTASGLISDFITPSPKTMALLSDSRLTSILSAASESLAPSGVTQDPTDRYAASVLETHLVARRKLMKFTNSLLKT